MAIDFKNIAYLKDGNARQQQVYAVLTAHQVLSKLQPYQPIVVGTIPIAIDIAESDIDIVLQATDLLALREVLTAYFGLYTAFEIQFIKEDVLLCNFEIDQIPVELFATPNASDQQNGYLHMLKEYEILQAKGEDFAEQVRKLKRQGIKTEPAFCQLLQLEGDPYEAILKYKLD